MDGLIHIVDLLRHAVHDRVDRAVGKKQIRHVRRRGKLLQPAQRPDLPDERFFARGKTFLQPGGNGDLRAVLPSDGVILGEIFPDPVLRLQIIIRGEIGDPHAVFGNGQPQGIAVRQHKARGQMAGLFPGRGRPAASGADRLSVGQLRHAGIAVKLYRRFGDGLHRRDRRLFVVGLLRQRPVPVPHGRRDNIHDEGDDQNQKYDHAPIAVRHPDRPSFFRGAPQR